MNHKNHKEIEFATISSQDNILIIQNMDQQEYWKIIYDSLFTLKVQY